MTRHDTQSANLPELQAQGALRLAIRVLAHALDHIKGGGDDDDGGDEQGREQEQVATEALRLILNLTLHLGPLSNPPNPLPKPDEVPHIPRIPPIPRTTRAFLTFSTTRHDQRHDQRHDTTRHAPRHDTTRA
jgi:hypothetical protein